MLKWWHFAPFAVLVAYGGWIGWTLGQPRDDGAVIALYASDYSEKYGGSLTDCEARPLEEKHLRMIIDCLKPTGAGLRYVIGKRGELVELIVLEEPQT